MAEEKEIMEVNASSSSVDSGTVVSLQIVVAPSQVDRHVSVLILTPQWESDRNGTSDITKPLIKNLRSIDPEGNVIKITIAVLQEEGHVERIKEAEDLKVHLKGYIYPSGTKKKSDEQWLNEDVMKYYHHIVSEGKHDFIIGHAPYFSDGCINLRDGCRENGRTPKVILFVHKLPRNVNEKIEEVLLREWLSKTDVVVSLTNATGKEIERQMKEINKEDVPLHKSYIPGYPVEPFHLDGGGRQFESERVINMLMPMKNSEIEGLDFSMAVNAVANACQRLGPTTLTMLTENKSNQEEWEKEFKRVLKYENQHLTFPLSVSPLKIRKNYMFK